MVGPQLLRREKYARHFVVHVGVSSLESCGPFQILFRGSIGASTSACLPGFEVVENGLLRLAGNVTHVLATI